MAFYVFDDKLCKTEGMTKEQIINAIAQATGTTPSDVDEGFISTIVENNKSRSIHIWKGTRAEFNALGSYSATTLYIIDDDTTISDFQSDLDGVKSNVQTLIENLGTTDTGWRDILRLDLEADHVLIGRYRIIGKTAYFNFGYELAMFTPSTTSDEITLPIRLDLTVYDELYSDNVCFAITSINEDDSAYVLGNAAIVNESASGNTKLKISAKSALKFVNLTFAYPVADAE